MARPYGGCAWGTSCAPGFGIPTGLSTHVQLPPSCLTAGGTGPAQIPGNDPDDGVDARSRIAARAARISVDPDADAGALH